jgi:anti-sigma regulatory factor (Ser/Thr protein kinase)
MSGSADFLRRLSMTEVIDEARVWVMQVEPQLRDLPRNVLGIGMHGFTEMLNNAREHSGGTGVEIGLARDEERIRLWVADDGLGVFEKVREAAGLADVRESILELAKGKLTTDPAHHSGEGIFFTSRMFDRFELRANRLTFIHEVDGEDWLVEDEPKNGAGTRAIMEIATTSARTAKEVFDRFANPESGDYAFSKTHVPVKLVRYGDEGLVSRSQAKRVLARFEKFAEVMLDFSGVDAIGPAFADEIFRIFPAAHPGINLIAIHAGDEVMTMIHRARGAGAGPA